MKITIKFNSIDWDLLCKQKQLLLEMIEDQPETSPLYSLWGLVHLIDDIQDQAAETGHPVKFGCDSKI